MFLFYQKNTAGQRDMTKNMIKVSFDFLNFTKVVTIRLKLSYLFSITFWY